MGMLLHRHSVSENVTTAQSLMVEPDVTESKKQLAEKSEEPEKKKPGRKPKEQ